MRTKLIICVMLMAALALGCAGDPTVTNDDSDVLCGCSQKADEQDREEKPMSTDSIPGIALKIRGGMTKSEVKAILGDRPHLVVGSGSTRYSYRLGEGKSLTIALNHYDGAARVVAAFYYDSAAEREVNLLENE